MKWFKQQVADMKNANPAAKIPDTAKLRMRKTNWDHKIKLEQNDWPRSEISQLVFEKWSSIIVGDEEVPWLRNWLKF